MHGLFCFQAEVDKNIELLKKKDEELSSALEKMENQSENNDIDEVIIPTAPLYKQILNLYAEENAIEDTIFYLGEALRRGVIDLDVFLKVGVLPRPPGHWNLCCGLIDKHHFRHPSSACLGQKAPQIAIPSLSHTS